MLIQQSRFPVVALFAKRLPIALIPKQRCISPVWFAVIHNRCRHQPPCPCTLRTKRMLCQESLSRRLPTVAVSTLVSTGSIISMLLSVKITIKIVRQSRATRMLARFLWFCRHEQFPPLHKKSPRSLLLQRPSRLDDSPMI